MGRVLLFADVQRRVRGGEDEGVAAGALFETTRPWLSTYSDVRGIGFRSPVFAAEGVGVVGRGGYVNFGGGGTDGGRYVGG